jgi:biotin carboxylase
VRSVQPVEPRRLLVLGAGEEQLPLYRAARQRGLLTVGVDQRPDAPAATLADAFLPLSTRDHEAIAEALGPVPVAGVVSIAADTCLLAWHELTERWRLPYRFPRRAALVSMDKASFHELAASIGLPGYGWVQSTDLAQAQRAAATLRLPLVVKPADASGSKGASLVDDPAGLPLALAHARQFSLDGAVIVEEFVVGRNLTVNVFLRGGVAEHALITDRRLLPGRHFVVDGHVSPAPLAERTRQRLVDEAVALCAAMGLVDGPANFDVILAPDGTPYVLEVGARMPGNGLTRLVAAAHGIDLVDALLALVLGEPFELTPTGDRHAVLHVLRSPVDGDGRLDAVRGLDELRALPGVADVEVVAPPGDVVRPATQGGKLGWLVVTGDSPGEADQALRAALSVLRMDVRVDGGAADRVVDSEVLPLPRRATGADLADQSARGLAG